jgi:putative flippase GtrA
MLTERKEVTVASSPEATGTKIKRIKHVGTFGLVGILNTLIDFVIYNLLSGEAGFSLIQANVVSTTCAMLFSFFANKHIVFKKKDGSIRQQALMFFLVTAFGLYVLQTGTIKLLTEVWTWPLTTIVASLHAAGLHGHDQFLVKNGAKAAATIVSLAWNYIIYKKVVFK